MNENRNAKKSKHNDTENHRSMLFGAIAFSVLCHILFISCVLFFPSLQLPEKNDPKIIKVNIVTLPKLDTPSNSNKAKPAKKAIPKLSKPVPLPVRKKIPLQQSIKKKEPIVSKKETKTDSLKKTFDRLREVVSKTDEKQRIKQEKKEVLPKPTKPDNSSIHYNNEETPLLDIYKAEVAYMIQQKWAFLEQIVGYDTTLETLLIFKVMSDGEITDIVFTKKSGNRYLDDSAYKAVIKSSPVEPHPNGVVLPYIQIGLRFTPQGVK